ncbi:MAG: hypothetical protein A2365_00675 [Candidatus Nealsonbacteria bacterium RIFOXYB1_FULL_40_15]|uniref:MtN3 and saliva related transmembrane protein n=2 Tax=Candidatus Nealsoniibacteriota TaxID=1817911 RepID=A0A1G2ESP0_9BACT|nr:MAG: hypothetical protein A2365_00675 [Candidatus Nealsonbacteria bacterium RIFOXYB1_FULL_40_15]OGZ28799.1 MAG: hypothetical protein A2427_01855 [Candidatus Nealsonbacteria bacterium RIFOXYC1_FULL_40_7]OGZ29070.1 MAG: hypothetical protein A2562_01110 [Candidatus Nealsonbacteria bacterium RIFOXYD1_FULL_39_11]
MLPQIVKSWKSGKTGDLSWGMAFLYFANCCLWLIYGLLIASLPMIMANGAGVAISLVQLFLKKKFG